MTQMLKQVGRDWELVPISSALGRQFAYDIFPSEFHRITGDLALIMLSDPIYLKAKASSEPRAPMIKRGALITPEMLRNLRSKNCTVVPVLIPGQPKPLNALTQFARQQTLMLAGRVYSCVEDWLRRTRQERAISVLQTIKKYRTPLLQSLNNALKDWEAVIVTLVNDILVADENLTILSLFDDFLGNFEKAKQQKEHSIEVAVLALMLARKCNLPVEDMKDLGLSALIHDLGMVVYEQKLKELITIGGQVLTPDHIQEIYNRHPLYGALLVTKKNGEPISGINQQTREIILEHEQKNNSDEPWTADPEFKDEVVRMNIPERILYVGNNDIFPDFHIPRDIVYPESNLVRRHLLIPSQILHISEYYVTVLNQFKQHNNKEPENKAVQYLLNEAGTGINGQIFEVFFNYLVPPQYYPDNLIIKLYFRDTQQNKKYERYNNHIGVIVTIKDLNNQPRKMIHIIKDSSGREIEQKATFDLIFDKKNMYLRIDDWNKQNPS
jgi:hypothetical protein